jgi:hypothetical protein
MDPVSLVDDIIYWRDQVKSFDEELQKGGDEEWRAFEKESLLYQLEKARKCLKELYKTRASIAPRTDGRRSSVPRGGKNKKK